MTRIIAEYLIFIKQKILTNILINKIRGSGFFLRKETQSPPKKYIIIYNNFFQSVKKYFRAGKNNDFFKPPVCPLCLIMSCLIGWGYYSRNACDGTKIYRIFIKIWKCKRCKRYISIHPTFLIPYRQYTLIVIYKTLRYYFKCEVTIQNILNKIFHPDIMPGYQLVQQWLKQIKKSSNKWIGILQSEIKEAIKKPTNKNDCRDVELVYFMMVLEKYFNSNAAIEIEKKHQSLVTKYRGSPFSKYKFK